MRSEVGEGEKSQSIGTDGRAAAPWETTQPARRDPLAEVLTEPTHN